VFFQLRRTMLLIMSEFNLDMTGGVEYVSSRFPYIQYTLELRVCMQHTMLMETVSFATQEYEYNHIQQ
jgi:hypothetical protein